jgi:very-short-patch-repair endonuclease
VRDNEKLSRRFAKRMPRAEALLWSYIRKRAVNGARFRRRRPVGPYVADFACIAAKLAIEIDGATHWTEDQMRHDARRSKYLWQQGWRALRVTSTDACENADGVWLALAHHFTPPTLPLRSGPPPCTREE